MDIIQNSHSSAPGEQVSLFRLDATSVGDTLRYFCQGKIGSNPIVFGEQSYTPIDISFTEFEVNAGGSLPQPRMQISNSNSVIQGMLNSWGDLIGCEIRRIRTWKRFLDGQPDADPAAFIGPDIFRLERKSDENPIFVEWELSAAIDQEGKMLPGRQVFRDSCVKRYRFYDPTNAAAAADGFVYATVNPCPYTGTDAFTIDGDATTSPNDRCGRKLSDCKLRFVVPHALPFGGFPGATRVQQ
jgi:lambda family phage minor tail protein L